MVQSSLLFAPRSVCEQYIADADSTRVTDSFHWLAALTDEERKNTLHNSTHPAGTDCRACGAEKEVPVTASAASASFGAEVVFPLLGNFLWPSVIVKDALWTLLTPWAASFRSRVAGMPAGCLREQPLEPSSAPGGAKTGPPDAMDFRRVGHDAVASLLDGVAGIHTAGASYTRADGYNYTLILPETWETFWKGQSKNFRKSIKARKNKLHKTYGAEQIETRCLSLSECGLETFWETGVQVAAQSWQGHEGKSVFLRNSFKSALQSMGETVEPSLYVLMVEERPVACNLTFSTSTGTLLYACEYHEELREFGIGNYLREVVFRDNIAKKRFHMDFGYGDSEHKQSWGGEALPLVRVIVPLTAKGHLYLWYRRLRWGAGALLRLLKKERV